MDAGITDMVLATLRTAAGVPLTGTEIARRTGIDGGVNISATLCTLHKQGRVARLGDKPPYRYTLPAQGATALPPPASPPDADTTVLLYGPGYAEVLGCASTTEKQECFSDTKRPAICTATWRMPRTARTAATEPGWWCIAQMTTNTPSTCANLRSSTKSSRW